MLERELERKCAKLAKDRGYWMPKWVSPGTRGVPDRILFGTDCVTFIEFKAPGKMASALQDYYIRVIEGYGCRAVIVDSVEDFKKLLKQ